MEFSKKCFSVIDMRLFWNVVGNIKNIIEWNINKIEVYFEKYKDVVDRSFFLILTFMKENQSKKMKLIFWPKIDNENKKLWTLCTMYTG